jgi:opacity protein-like surface antigen
MVGATVAHQVSGALGGEAGFRLTGAVDAFVEGGHLWNVGTQDLDARAQTIAHVVGADVSDAYRVTYLDAGVRLHWIVMPKLRPYLTAGAGVARVRTDTVLTVSGQIVKPETVGIELGPDLNGSVNKPLLTIGGGATLPLQTHLVADLSVRYGRIWPVTSAIPNDRGINTVRLQVGVGILIP